MCVINPDNIIPIVEETTTVEKKKRGRPIGSKNKPKEVKQEITILNNA